MIFKPVLIATLETALNHYLALDNSREDLLIPLKGKIIALTIEPLNETLYLCPTGDAIQIIDQIVGQPDTTICGSVWALGSMGMSANPMRSVFSGEIKITGDIQAGKLFQAVFKKLVIDWEGLAANYVGQGVANQLSQFLRAGQAWSKDSLQTFKLNAAEFLQEETRDLPAKPEMDYFNQQVDNLRTHYDRLEARLERIAQHTLTQQKK